MLGMPYIHPAYPIAHVLFPSRYWNSLRDCHFRSASLAAAHAASFAASHAAFHAAAHAAALVASFAAASCSCVASPLANALATRIASLSSLARWNTRSAQSHANSRAVLSFQVSNLRIKRAREATMTLRLSFQMYSPSCSASHISGPSHSTNPERVQRW
jgi:hypothetical protein